MVVTSSLAASRSRLTWALAAVLIVVGLGLRVHRMTHAPLWIDEAESCINGLTILQHGLPTSEYLGMPIYENTLIEPWDDHPEYEFRDSSYSRRGVAVYHGWLPLYAIAAAQAVGGIKPDVPSDPPRAVHGVEEIFRRTVVPRLPAIVFSLGFMLCGFAAARVAGDAAGLSALAWIALHERAVWFGSQARYYSLTLLLTTTAVLLLWHAVRHGRWRAFIWLGVVVGLLFHTHQISATVFSVAAVATLPWTARHEQWRTKVLVACGITLALVVPWVLLTGFLDAAIGVPKVYVLFTTWRDWLGDAFQRPRALALLVVALLALVGARAAAGRFPQWWDRLRPHIGPSAFLVGWMVLIYGAFHVVMPAASFMRDRLTLMIFAPWVLLMGLVIGGVCRAVSDRLAAPLALVVTLFLLGATGKFPTHAGPAVDEPAPLVTALGRRDYEPGTRFYAPQLHFMMTYLTGLPVQSPAPVRRSFFENHQPPVVGLEIVYTGAWASETEIAAAAQRSGRELDAATVAAYRQAIWKTQVLADLRSRGIDVPEAEGLPAFLDPVVAATAAAWERTEADLVRSMRRHLIFRDVDASVTRLGDMWRVFYWRFIDYRARLGEGLNILPRLREAEVELLPEYSSVVFFCRPLSPDRP